MATQPLKPFKAQYTFTLAAHGLADAGRQQRDFLEMAADLGFYPAEGSVTALGGMNPMEVVPGSVLDQELQSDSRGGASELPTGVATDAPSGESDYEMEVRIVSRPDVDGGQPVLLAAGGVRVSALTDRLIAGDSVKEVARDFEVDVEEVILLNHLIDSLVAARPSTGSVG